MKTTIRFIQTFRHFKPGDTDSEMEYGTHDSLVSHRRVAVWTENPFHPELVEEDAKPRQTRRHQKETVS